MKKRRIKDDFIDDGHTIYNMDIEGMPHRKEKPKLNLNKKERRALVSAAYGKFLPILGICILGFGLAMLLIYFWLK